jgi:hypothetical protein
MAWLTRELGLGAAGMARSLLSKLRRAQIQQYSASPLSRGGLKGGQGEDELQSGRQPDFARLRRGSHATPCHTQEPAKAFEGTVVV